MIEGKISVLMGIYNCADTLVEAVDSIRNQIYKNWQLIMCDDCSTDNTYEVAKSIADSDPDKFLLIRNDKNMKLQYTLNHCFRYADGEFIARMDGDDKCSPDRFEKEIAFLKNHPEYSLVSCQMSMFDVNGTFRTVIYKSEPDKDDLLSDSQFCHAGCMIRSDIFKKLNGYSEDESCVRVEDYDLWIRMYAAGYKGYNLQEVLYQMRDDRNALHRRNFKNRLNESKVKLRAGQLFKMPIKGIVYATLPILKFLVPYRIYNSLHRKRNEVYNPQH